MSDIGIDRFDLQLPAALQRVGHATNATLVRRTNLSASQSKVKETHELPLVTWPARSRRSGA